MRHQLYWIDMNSMHKKHFKKFRGRPTQTGRQLIQSNRGHNQNMIFGFHINNSSFSFISTRSSASKKISHILLHTYYAITKEECAMELGENRNVTSEILTRRVHGRMAGGNHGLPKVSLGPAMPDPSMPCGRASPETTLQLFQGWLTCRVSSLWPSSTLLDTPHCTPMEESHNIIRRWMMFPNQTFLRECSKGQGT
jgi:hypothetical protein